MYKKSLLIYIACVHVILAVVLIKSDFIYLVKEKISAQPEEFTEHYRTMVAFHMRIDRNTPSESTIFIGDSHIQGLAVSAISPNAVNYGIGNDSTVGVIERLPYYESLSSSKLVVLAIGFNDLKRRNNEEITENIKTILMYIPSKSRIILCAINPVGEKKHETYGDRINILNNSLRQISMQYSNVTYLNSFKEALSPKGYLQQKYLLPDNIHLSEQGYSIWIAKLTDIINNG